MALSADPVPEQGAVSYPGLGEGVTFSAPTWDRDVEITGPLAAKLWVSSATEDADLFLIVRLFDPGGEEVHFAGTVDPRTPIAQGWLRASHRGLDPSLSEAWRPYHPHDEIQPLEPGRPYEVDVEIWPTCIVVPAGYRLALTVQGKDYEHAGPGAPIWGGAFEMRGSGVFVHDDARDRPEEVFGGEVTIHGGGDTPSHLLLPVIPEA